MFNFVPCVVLRPGAARRGRRRFARAKNKGECEKSEGTAGPRVVPLPLSLPLVFFLPPVRALSSPLALRVFFLFFFDGMGWGSTRRPRGGDRRVGSTSRPRPGRMCLRSPPRPPAPRPARLRTRRSSHVRPTCRRRGAGWGPGGARGGDDGAFFWRPVTFKVFSSSFIFGPPPPPPPHRCSRKETTCGRRSPAAASPWLAESRPRTATGVTSCYVSRGRRTRRGRPPAGPRRARALGFRRRGAGVRAGTDCCVRLGGGDFGAAAGATRRRAEAEASSARGGARLTRSRGRRAVGAGRRPAGAGSKEAYCARISRRPPATTRPCATR